MHLDYIIFHVIIAAKSKRCIYKIFTLLYWRVYISLLTWSATRRYTSLWSVRKISLESWSAIFGSGASNELETKFEFYTMDLLVSKAWQEWQMLGWCLLTFGWRRKGNTNKFADPRFEPRWSRCSVKLLEPN